MIINCDRMSYIPSDWLVLPEEEQIFLFRGEYDLKEKLKVVTCSLPKEHKGVCTIKDLLNAFDGQILSENVLSFILDDEGKRKKRDQA